MQLQDDQPCNNADQIKSIKSSKLQTFTKDGRQHLPAKDLSLPIILRNSKTKIIITIKITGHGFDIQCNLCLNSCLMLTSLQEASAVA